MGRSEKGSSIRPIHGMVTVRQILDGFLAGSVTDHEAMDALHMETYADLINALADIGEAPPLPPKAEVEAEVEAALPLIRKRLQEVADGA
ncbi:hypothetical protein [Defluviimonas salinarum]|uniref:Uncharacterized protein n=1 Tax=Defluviimonas salinarum TaxID=2992147 RepID=A0ABT3J5G6_9RHOB|nr:hypothetical protein [Defluviimonas salinarum]MCW3782923.1 hypothetical protein [Defluviimonas salinarum]